jgi:photosystem II stability/assembly factor-like uncharacterized protein
LAEQVDFIPAMNPKRFLALALFAWLAAAPAGEARAQWARMKGRSLGNTVRIFVVNGSNLFVATGNNWNKGDEGGIFRSIDSGKSWREVGKGWPAVSTLQASGLNLIAGTDDHGIFCSTDLGKHWSSADSGLNNNYNGINTLTSIGQNVFVGLAPFTGCDLFRSSNEGGSWQCSNSGLPDGGMVFCFSQIAAKLFAGTNHGVYLSTDNGVNWNPASNGMPISDSHPSFVKVLAENGDNIFAVIGAAGLAGAGGGIFRSNDDGKSWTPAHNGLTDNGAYVSSIVAVDKILFAADFGVFRSTDNGASWLPVNTGVPEQAKPCSLQVFGKYLLAGDQDGLVWRRPLSELIQDVR